MKEQTTANLSAIHETLLKKLNLLLETKVMSLSPVDSDITSISRMLDERQDHIDEIAVLDEQVNQLVETCPISQRTALKSILGQKTPANSLSGELLDIDKTVKKIYNELNAILVCNAELDTKLSFIKDNLVMQIKQINNNNQIFKYSSGTVGAPIGTVMDTKN